ncbi:unnamed protein product [Trichobilharzia szidati]|nr:unnamed protein product [Trichobilharzia szidati]
MNPAESLPPGWEMRFDPRTERWYFVDHNTRSTQWEHPVTNKAYSPQPTRNVNINNNNNNNNNNSNGEQDCEQQVTNAKISNCESIITDVISKARALQPEINRFEGSPQSKEYRCLMESMEQMILNLDALNMDGNEDYRSMRRDAVKEIQQLIEMLDYRSQISSTQNGQQQEEKEQQQEQS